MVPPPPPAETAKVTLPVAAAESSKDTADASLAGEIGSVSEGVSVNAAAVNTVFATALVNPVTEANQKESLGEEEEEEEDGSSSHGSNSSGEEYTGGSNDDEEYEEDSILVRGEDEEDEELDQKPPERKGEIDDGILLLSDEDEAGKKVVCHHSDEAIVVKMLKEAEGFFQHSLEGLCKRLCTVSVLCFLNEFLLICLFFFLLTG